MNIVKRIEQYDENYIFFCEPIKNNVMSDGNFIRIIYSTNYFTLNGIYLLITLENIICEKYYNKYKCNFDIVDHSDIIDNLKVIEEDLLKKIDITDKVPQFKIYEQIKNGNIKVFNEIVGNQTTHFVLKISGVWETQYNYGLTYKFFCFD
jgi:hypothetical protein